MSFWLSTYDYSSRFTIFMSHDHHYLNILKLPETGCIYRFRIQFMAVYDSSRHKQVSDCLKPNPALGNSFEYVFCEIAAFFVQEEMSPFHGPHTFGRDRLAQDSAVCCAWTTVEQSRHYRTDSTLVGHYVDHSWYTPTERLRHCMVADELVSNMHQAIGNNHADVIMFILRVKGFILHPLNGHPSVSLLLRGSAPNNDNVLCDVHNLSMKIR